MQRILEEIQISYPLMFDDHEIVQRETDECECFASIHMFASAVVDNLEDRFPDLPIWSSLRIFDPLSNPSKVSKLRGFGDENVKTLLNHFGEPKVVEVEIVPSTALCTWDKSMLSCWKKQLRKVRLPKMSHRKCVNTINL